VRNVIDSLYWRLVLRGAHFGGDAEERKPYKGGAQDFHSLVWERLTGTRWRAHVSITARRFRKHNDAWVHDVHSIDPATGVAIIQIVEDEKADIADLPPSVLEEAKTVFPSLEGLRSYRAQYSWVSWNMRMNEKISLLKRCQSPFEQYDG